MCTAYELESTEQRRNCHMKYGILLCTHTFVNGIENNSSLFFTSVNQINKGGPDAIQDPNHRSKIAELNVKAGKLSIVLSDYTTALKFFEYGISFLREDCWTALLYQLSVDLYDATVEAAFALEKFQAVKSYTDELVENAYSFDDSLHCKF
jgi:predicted ATPase